MILLESTFASFKNTGIATVINDIEKVLKKNRISYQTVSYFDFYKKKSTMDWYKYYNVDLNKKIKTLSINDTFVCPANLGGFLLYKKRKCQSVFLIHDIFEYTSKKGIKRFIQKIRFTKILNNVDKIITISKFSQNEIEIFFPRTNGKINVCFSASINILPEKKLTEPWIRDNKELINSGKFLLANGSGQPRKNAEFLIKYAKSLYMDFGLKLVLFGKDFYNDGYLKLKKEIQENNVESFIIHVGEVTNQELNILYKRTACFIFPSTYEGLGIPPLEALNQGARCAVSDIPVFKETMKPMTCFFDFSYESLKNTITNIMKINESEYDTLRKAVLSKFTNEIFEQNILKLFCYNER